MTTDKSAPPRSPKVDNWAQHFYGHFSNVGLDKMNFRPLTSPSFIGTLGNLAVMFGVSSRIGMSWLPCNLFQRSKDRVQPDHPAEFKQEWGWHQEATLAEQDVGDDDAQLVFEPQVTPPKLSQGTLDGWRANVGKDAINDDLADAWVSSGATPFRFIENRFGMCLQSLVGSRSLMRSGTGALWHRSTLRRSSKMGLVRELVRGLNREFVRSP